MSFTPQHIRAGMKHLRAADPVLREVIDRVGPFRMKLQRHRFRALVQSILSQQISGGAARSIRARLERLAGPGGITVDSISRLAPEELRSAGLSPQKTGYLLDLTAKVREGAVRLRSVSRMPDEAVIEELVQVKGIGVWTAQMFLMFSLARPDVFPPDDFGIRSALRNLYGLRELPDRETSRKIAAPWRPYATIASWYCWRSLDLPKSEA